MDFIYAAIYLILGGFAVLLLIFLSARRHKVDSFETNDAILGPDEMERHAVETARKHETGNNSLTAGRLIARMERNYKYIFDTYRSLNSDAEGPLPTSPASEWILDNFYVIEDQYKDIRHSFSAKNFSRLPVLKNGYLRGYPRVYAIALELVSHTDGMIDEKSILGFIKAYQTQTVLSIGELWAIAAMLRVALFEAIRQMCEKIMETRRQWRIADGLAEIIEANLEKDEDILFGIFNDHIRASDTLNPSCVEHLLQRFRKMGNKTSAIIRYLDNRLAEQNSSIEDMAGLEHQIQAARQVTTGNLITSLRFVSAMDWASLFETLSQVEQILRKDPSNVYHAMDFESRDYYRSIISKMARAYDLSEVAIAKKVLECALQDIEHNGSKTPCNHVGYYLVGKGVKILQQKLGSKRQRPGSTGLPPRHPALVYIGSILLLTAATTGLFVYYASERKVDASILVLLLSGLVVLIPASDIAVSLVNFLVCRSKCPGILPKLELGENVPDELATMVIIPTLLPNEKRAKELVEQLEVHYLANKSDNVYFALVGDYKDAASKDMPEDKAIIEAALKGVEQLNKSYAPQGRNIFFYLHRHRQYNPAQNKWMGWERKRGAITELNELLLGSSHTSYTISSSDISQLPSVKYILTLDADTNLPIGSAKKLIGTIAHPLNKAVIDKEKGIVSEGYGLIQPRIGISIAGANNSLFSKIYAGQGGIDTYSAAISDVYQDLFGEGIFTGKGIYELRVFHDVLDNAIPENSILSHDLLEGSYIRTGLATDIELVDGYPAKYNSYAMRLHRWVRGDWQLLPWLVGTVTNKQGHRVKNPLNFISRWKILDNMRRSLLNPALLILIVLGLVLLPGNAMVWLGLAVLTTAFPVVIYMAGLFVSGRLNFKKRKNRPAAMGGLKSCIYQAALQFIFIPYQAYLMCDAIFRTVLRVLFTRKNLLEWITAADMEASLKNGLMSFFKKMWFSLFSGAAILLLTFFYSPGDLPYAAVLLVLWGTAFYAAYKISRKYEQQKENLSEEDIRLIRRLSRKTWRYFEDFVTSKDNFLPPDNYQEEPPNGIAHRTSPTNIGMEMVSSLCARDLGFIGILEMGKRLENTISVVEKMEKWEGHLYNWYDTVTLEVLRPRYVSTVDSGNLVAYLMVLEQSLDEWLKKPILNMNMVLGIRDTIEIFNEELKDRSIDTKRLEDLVSSGSCCLDEWKRLIQSLQSDIAGQIDELSIRRSLWGGKAIKMLQAFEEELKSLVPLVGITPDKYVKRRKETELVKDILEKCSRNASIDEYKRINSEEAVRLGKYISEVKNSKELRDTEDLQGLRALEKDIGHAENNIKSIQQAHKTLIERIRVLINNTRFTPLFDQRRQLFSIGYNVEEGRLTKSYYDQLASEARQASFIAIARGEVDKKHWFKLGRRLTMVDGWRGMVSWTGTMFEYIMPLMIMRNYENTLLDETYSFVVNTQKGYGRERRIPWGVSESAYYAFDLNLNYQYKAFGIPELGLKRGLINDVVISPYATALALVLDPAAAVANMRKLIDEGMEGVYGMYEAIDYTPSRIQEGKDNNIVKNFMVHHQGMSMLAFNNYLNKNIMQARFHSSPLVKSAELLLQERVPSNAILVKEIREKFMPARRPVFKEGNVIRKFGVPETHPPHMHILSNGSYSVLVTDGGSGYSRSGDMAIARWKENSRGTGSGVYIFVQNINSNTAWSATYEPFKDEPEDYTAVFSADKAEFTRKDGNIETRTEVIVSTEDNAEIRRVSLTNRSQHSRVLEITSYFEVVLTSPDADIAHPAFSNLFVITEYNADHDCLMAARRPRSEGKKSIWAVHTVAVEGEVIGDIQYETDRSKFIGRNRDISSPVAMEIDQPLSNTVGPVLDPIMSIRKRVRIEAGHTIRLSFVIAVAENRDNAFELAEKYRDPKAVERSMELAWTRSQIELGYLGFNPQEVQLYLDLLPSILLPGPIRRKWAGMILANTKGQPDLWPFGVSGDVPVVLVVLKDKDEIDIVYRLLKAHEYWRMKGVNVDLVMMMEDESSYTQPLNDAIRDAISSSHARDLMGRRGGVFVLNANLMSQESRNLFYATARLVLRGDGGPIEEQFKLDDDPDEVKLDSLMPISAGIESKTVMESPCQCFDYSKLKFFNGVGGFSQDGKEYIINLREGNHTPAPWINVISNRGFGFLVSEVGGGYTWAENSRENKITPWSNDPVTDPLSEVFYLRDEKTGSYWTVTPMPVRGREDYTITHGHGYTTFDHTSHGLEQKLTEFVSIDESVKICIVKLRNISAASRELSVTYCTRPVLGVNDKITAQYITTSVNGKTGTLLAANSYNSDFPGRVTFIDTSEEARTYTGDMLEFTGLKGSFSEPEAMRRRELSGKVGAGLEPCAAMQVKISLAEGEEKDIVFLLGQAKSSDQAITIAGRYRSAIQAMGELDRVKQFWDERLGLIQVSTPDQSMDIMLNGWLLYQVVSCRLWSRSAFYQSGGAYGFRDQLQDVMAVAYNWPELMRKQILFHSEHQFIEGDVQHWWHTGADKGIRTRYSDDFLWLAYVTADYIRCTGDWAILDEVTHYLEDEPLDEGEDERYNIPRISEKKGTLYEHCIKAINNALKFGRHGIPLMGSGDWNDGMNTVGNKGKGESVWLGWFVYTTLKNFIPICRERRDDESAVKYESIAAEIAQNIEENAWDGSWYRRAYFDDGTPLGSVQNTECRIDAIAQSWSAISGVGRPHRVEEALNALENYLVDREEGIIKLLTPPFNESELEPGYIKGYVPGVRENGGQYTHAAVWAVMAFTKLGRGDRAWELFNMINPINHSRTPIECSRYKVEPYVMAADVYAVHPNLGRGGWTWYTGAAGWMYRVGLEHILGVKKEGNNLVFDPCIPKNWGEYTVKYRFGTSMYNILVKNQQGVNKGVKSVAVDGNVCSDGKLMLLDDGGEHNVEVVMG